MRFFSPRIQFLWSMHINKKKQLPGAENQGLEKVLKGRLLSKVSHPVQKCRGTGVDVLSFPAEVKHVIRNLSQF